MTHEEASVLSEILKKLVRRGTSVRLVGRDNLTPRQQPDYGVEVHGVNTLIVIDKASTYEVKRRDE